MAILLRLGIPIIMFTVYGPTLVVVHRLLFRDSSTIRERRDDPQAHCLWFFFQ